MASIHDVLTNFNIYLTTDEPSTGELSTVSDSLNYYNKKLLAFRHDFHTVTIDDPALQEKIQAILNSLAISPVRKKRVTHAPLTVYEFLVELVEITDQKNEKIKKFVELIKRKDKLRKKTIEAIALTLLTALSVATPLLLDGGFELLYDVFTSLLFAPIVGVIFTTGFAAYSFYQSYSDKKSSFWKQFRDHFFLFAHAALKIAAYSLILSAAVAMTPVSAILLVVAAVVYVVKEAVNLIKTAIENKKNGSITADDTLEVQLGKKRIAVDCAKSKNALAIELGAAVAMVGIVVVMSFVPGGIFVSIGAVAALGLVYLVKKLLISKNEKSMHVRLQRGLKELESKAEEEEGKGLQQKPQLEGGNNMKPETAPVTEPEFAIQAVATHPVPTSHDEPAGHKSKVSQIGIFAVRGNSSDASDPEAEHNIEPR